MTQEVLEDHQLIEESSTEEEEKRPQPKIQKHSFLEFLTDVWVDKRTMRILLDIIQKVILLLSVDDNFVVKRVVQVILGCTKRALKDLCQELKDKDRLHSMSLERFVGFLSSDELYMTLFEEAVPEEARTLLYQQHKAELQHLISVSSSGMEPTTSISSMIAHTVSTDVDAPGCEKSVVTDLSDEDALFGAGTSVASTSKIPFRMQRKTSDILITWSAEETSSYEVVKFDVMPFGKCSVTDKRDWWRNASSRIQFVTSSNVDPLYQHLRAIMGTLNKRMLAKPEKHKEEKDANSKFGF